MLWGMDSSMTWYILKASVHGSFGIMHADNVLFGTLSVTDIELSFQRFFVKSECENSFGEIAVCWKLMKQSSYTKIRKGEKNKQLILNFTCLSC